MRPTPILGLSRGFSTSRRDMKQMFELLKADHDAGQGTGYWETYLSLAFPRLTRFPGYAFEDLRKISVPTMILTGDRDQFCSVEEGVTAYRILRDGELAVLPDTGHLYAGRDPDDGEVLRA